MHAKDVFTPFGFPKLTFIDEHLGEKARILKDALDVGNSLIAISGPSKSGKTVFVENIVGHDNLIHVTGSGVDRAEKLWDRVFDQIGAPVSNQRTEETGFAGSIGGKIGALGVQGELEGSATWKAGTTEAKAIDYQQTLVRELGGSGFVIFIDDFHYITADAQIQLAQQIKEAIRQNVSIIAAAVPYHSDDALRANSDLRGRMVSIDFDYWEPGVLSKIADKGFEALNVEYSNEMTSNFAREAAGSPQLMQSLCLNACLEANCRKKEWGRQKLPQETLFFRQVCMRTALTVDYSSTVGKMKEGPKTRGTERKTYRLEDGNEFDVYPIVLRAVALDPPELTHRYSNLQQRIEKICRGSVPVGSSVTGACEHLAAIANDSAAGQIVEWDSANDVLDIRDPYLLFYLRWSEFAD
jgi:hypothetical protein